MELEMINSHTELNDTNWKNGNEKRLRQRGSVMKTLKDVKVGKTVVIAKVHGEGALRRRIMDMGLTKGTEIYVRKVAPLGDPMELNVRGYELSVRKADAEMIEVL